MSKEKFKLKFAVYLIPRRDNQVLLSLRKNTGWMDGNYSLIAGHVEELETAQEAIIRETKEEGGVALNEDDLQFIHVLHRVKDDPDNEYIDLFFECYNWNGEFVNNEPEKCGGLEWYDIANLPDNILPYVRDVIEMSQEDIHFSSRRSEL